MNSELINLAKQQGVLVVPVQYPGVRYQVMLHGGGSLYLSTDDALNEYIARHGRRNSGLVSVVKV
jgi:hypothetical protein